MDGGLGAEGSIEGHIASMPACNAAVLAADVRLVL
jgi:hypothetical protein